MITDKTYRISQRFYNHHRRKPLYSLITALVATILVYFLVLKGKTDLTAIVIVLVLFVVFVRQFFRTKRGIDLFLPTLRSHELTLKEEELVFNDDGQKTSIFYQSIKRVKVTHRARVTYISIEQMNGTEFPMYDYEDAKKLVDDLEERLGSTKIYCCSFFESFKMASSSSWN